MAITGTFTGSNERQVPANAAEPGTPRYCRYHIEIQPVAITGTFTGSSEQ